MATGTASASAYSQPYTAAFGPALTGQGGSVVVYVFDASGVCRVGPASVPGLNGASSTTGPNNEPTVVEGADYTGYQATGTYRAVLPLDTSWGPLHVHFVITGQAGVSADGSVPNRGPDAADGYTASLPGSLATAAGVTALPSLEATAVWGAGARTLTAQADSPGVGTLLTRLGTPAGASIDADILSRLASSGYTAPPSDYQQRGVAVTLPGTAPAGYGGSGGGTAPTAVAIRQEIDANSTQLASIVGSQSAQSAAIAALPSASAIASAVLAASVDGAVTLKQSEALALAVDAGRYAVGALNTAAHTKTFTYYRQDGTTVLATSTVTYDATNVAPVSRAVVFSSLP